MEKSRFIRGAVSAVLIGILFFIINMIQNHSDLGNILLRSLLFTIIFYEIGRAHV